MTIRLGKFLGKLRSFLCVERKRQKFSILERQIFPLSDRKFQSRWNENISRRLSSSFFHRKGRIRIQITVRVNIWIHVSWKCLPVLSFLLWMVGGCWINRKIPFNFLQFWAGKNLLFSENCQHKKTLEAFAASFQLFFFNSISSKPSSRAILGSRKLFCVCFSISFPSKWKKQRETPEGPEILSLAKSNYIPFPPYPPPSSKFRNFSSQIE